MAREFSSCVLQSRSLWIPSPDYLRGQQSSPQVFEAHSLSAEDQEEYTHQHQAQHPYAGAQFESALQVHHVHYRYVHRSEHEKYHESPIFQYHASLILHAPDHHRPNLQRTEMQPRQQPRNAGQRQHHIPQKKESENTGSQASERASRIFSTRLFRAETSSSSSKCTSISPHCSQAKFVVQALLNVVIRPQFLH